jgi:eukaryotic-like serine/threonine-protein kinase
VTAALVLGASFAWAHWRRAVQVPPSPAASAAPAPEPAPKIDPPEPEIAVPAAAPPPARRVNAPAAHHAPKRTKGSGGKDCDPPYRIDNNGHKQFKPECF